MHQQRNIALIGCGAIGAVVAESLHAELRHSFTLTHFCDALPDKAEALAQRLGGKAARYEDAIPECDVVLEAATAAAMPAILRTAWRHNKPCIALSVGGFALDPELLREAEQAACPVYLPSGAIAGLDGVLALRELGLDEVSLTTTKHPRSLSGVPYLEQQGFTPSNLSGPLTVFEGSAGEAIRNFPANVNVAITLSLAGIGFERTQVRLVADPDTTRTIHTIVAKAGDCMISATTTGIPLPQNPKSSLLAVESAIALCRRLASFLRPGL
jgi:aspartate dehydrogenase